MAYTTIKKPTDYFNTKLYSGNASTQAITGVGFQPDWCWFKGRNFADNHVSIDAVRGTNKAVYPDTNGAETTQTHYFTSFDSDGYTLGNSGIMNGSSKTYASWNWKANGSGSANTDGSINSTVSVNSTAGFSIVKYSGDPNANTTIGHGLGAVPKLIITKCITTTHNWGVYHHSLGVDKYLRLDTTDSEQSSSGAWGSTPTSSVFGVGGLNENDQASQDYIAYCFAEKIGYSKMGKYIGNGNVDGTFVYTGFKPALVITKRTDSTSPWYMMSDKISDSGGGNPLDRPLWANDSQAENDGDNDVDFLSNGFKIRDTGQNQNGNGSDYVYYAVASEPLVGDNPATAR